MGRNSSSSSRSSGSSSSSSSSSSDSSSSSSSSGGPPAAAAGKASTAATTAATAAAATAAAAAAAAAAAGGENKREEAAKEEKNKTEAENKINKRKDELLWTKMFIDLGLRQKPPPPPPKTWRDILAFLGVVCLAALVASEFGYRCYMDYHYGFEAIDTANAKQLKEVMFGGKPWILLCRWPQKRS
ncbi:hypothetical protein, conserved [Eimeria brunetti]|uniref:Uncharacterized protein n=1 Tax=Eimeria brunetti TaxID=51314 RepID=U6LJQ6_9EIME|nr:hypothetical protein, conserved [Eimeria brunetti]